tara:strand:- start:1673 stop:2131 length:459 start_codon:yes stop_codon:yes gene_type:complete
MDRIERQLKRPFAVSKLKWRKGGGGKELVYITARDVQDRLDEVFGPSGWQSSYEYMGERMVCKIECFMEGKWIGKCDGADDTSIEGAKGGLSDAFKRCGVMWGIFRYGYHASAFDSQKKPASWATPEGFDKLMEQRDRESTNEWKEEYSNAA